ncbi:Protein of unknown function [Lactobacillus delbrueckii subsp. bulgaricus]|nr:Protein of unknown function [Lactobacillus delbrueckii subsp. bulgaricus]
MCTNGPL